MTGERATRRVFFACRVPPDVGRRALELVRGVLPESDFRFPRPEGLHLTLHFLGDVGEELLEPLGAALEASSREHASAALEASLEGTGAFPGRGRERVLWAGVRCADGEQRLERLRAAALEAAAAVGLDVARETGRPFQPHVTLARPRSTPRVPSSFYELPLRLGFRSEAVELLEAVRAPSGPNVYVTRSSLRLGR